MYRTKSWRKNYAKIWVIRPIGDLVWAYRYDFVLMLLFISIFDRLNLICFLETLESINGRTSKSSWIIWDADHSD